MKTILQLQKLPGIVALFAFNPETAKPMNELAEVLLHNKNNSLTPGERELIAALVSQHNQTEFCENSHRAFAEHTLRAEGKSDQYDFDKIFTIGVSQIKDQKLRMLCRIALRTADNNPDEVAELANKIIANGLANEEEVHDAVLIAAAFCMYNRYVRCLHAPVSKDTQTYLGMAEKIYNDGYTSTTPVSELSH